MVGSTLKGKDGQTYKILRVDRPSPVPTMPNLARYTVERLSDNGTIENFPGYLLEDKDG